MGKDADLYFSRMNLERYRGKAECGLCHVESFEELVERIRSGGMKSGACPHWPEWKVRAFEIAVNAGDYLPSVPMLDLPRPVPPQLYALAEVSDSSPLLITGNNEFTRDLMLAVLSTATAGLRLLSVDTKGHTVDMAMVFKELTAEKIERAIHEHLERPRAGFRVILPGLARPLAEELSSRLGREVEVGPVCAAELPLFMGEAWFKNEQG